MFIDLGDIFLRALLEKDLEGRWYEWFNDPDVTRYMEKGVFPNTPSKQAEYLAYLHNSVRDVVFAVIDRETDRHVGNIGLHEIDYINSRAVVGLVIGEKEFRGRGIGPRCIGAVKKYAFETLNLHRLMAYTMSENKAAFKAFSSQGFKKEGVFVDHFYKRGRYLDAVMMGCTRDMEQRPPMSETPNDKG